MFSVCVHRDYCRKLFWAAIPYGRERVTNVVWVHPEGVPNAAGGLGSAVKPPMGPGG